MRMHALDVSFNAYKSYLFFVCYSMIVVIPQELIAVKPAFCYPIEPRACQSSSNTNPMAKAEAVRGIWFSAE
jgi:hypothetical protein